MYVVTMCRMFVNGEFIYFLSVEPITFYILMENTVYFFTVMLKT